MTLFLASLLWLSELSAFTPPTPYLEGIATMTQPEPPKTYNDPLFLSNDEVWFILKVDDEDEDTITTTIDSEMQIDIGRYRYTPQKNMTPCEATQLQLLFLIITQYPNALSAKSIEAYIKRYHLERHFK